MATYLALGALISLALWGSVISRFITVLKRRALRHTSAWRQAWLSWIALFGVAVASTFYNPFVRSALEVQLGPWFDKSLYVGAVVVWVYVIWTYLCYEFAPHLRPRWDWPLNIGLLTTAVGGFVMWAVKFGKVVPAFAAPNSSPTSILFLTFALVVVARIMLPALIWAYRHERQKPMRARFVMMSAVHLSVALWVLTSVVEHLLLGIGRSYYFLPLFIALMVVFAVTFVLSYLTPAAFFVNLIQIYEYFGHLRAFMLVRKIEVAANRWTGRETKLVIISDAVLYPAEALYRSVIAIFDRRKALQIQGASDAGLLGRQIGEIARPDLEYSEIVVRLCAMRRQLRNQL